jgi:hypothetical protein
MRAYYGTRFSPNLTRTPEGFLICHNVPIARTGWQEYLGRELGLNDKYDQLIRVYRDPKEVFSTETMASFEGKPAVDEHPSDDVRPDNVSSYLKGIARDIRRGTGDDSDLLFADLVIYDPILISEIEHGKREVSCGYDCVYMPQGENEYTQEQIRGNHVAIVTKGRAGDRVAIKDAAPEDIEPKPNEKPKDERSTQRMRRTESFLNHLLGRGFKQFVADEAVQPEDVMDAVEGVQNELNAAKAPEKTETAPAAAPAAAPAEGGMEARMTAIEGMMKDLVSVVQELISAEKPAQAEANPLDGLEGELTQAAAGGDDPEEAVTVPAEEMHDDAGPVAEKESLPRNPIAGADAATIALNTLRTMKPIIAAIPDPAERKKAADALTKTLRGSLAPAPSTTQSYAKMVAPAKPAKDSQPVDQTELGKQWAKEHNPHYMKKEGK